MYRYVMVGVVALAMSLWSLSGWSVSVSNEEKISFEGIGPVVEVKVISTEGCPTAPLTIKRIKEVSHEMGVSLDLQWKTIIRSDEISENRFFGSPTVQVNGLDIEPEMRTSTKYGKS